MAATPEGAARTAPAPHGNAIEIDGVEGLNSGGALGSGTLRPGEEGGVEGDGLSGTSDSDGDGRLLEEGGFSERSADSDSDGKGRDAGGLF